MSIAIVGAGFGGLAAAGKISKLRDQKILLFDKNRYTTMFPALPDVAGDKIEPRFLKGDIARRIPPNVSFVNERVISLDLDESLIHTSENEYHFDYLLIATGSVTNFFGFDQNLNDLYTLTSLEEAERIRREFPSYLEKISSPHVVLSGAGYTALELASHLSVMAASRGVQLKITLVEKAKGILPFLSPKQKKHIIRYLRRKNFEVKTNNTIEHFDGNGVRLESGEEYEDVFLCWTTGTKFSIPEVKGDLDRLRDGRIKVLDTLQAPGYANVFACGDSAAIHSGETYLRKAVNFAIYSGASAGGNLYRLIRKKPLRPFRPIDLGWVIPLHKDSVGLVFGKIPLYGKIGLRMHYMMCGYRNYNLPNRTMFLKMALRLY